MDPFHHPDPPLNPPSGRWPDHDAERETPRILVGLTATPERTDAEDILHHFDNRIAVELRLWDALERGLLCPFQHVGLHDNTDLHNVTWSRRGYDTAELERVCTGDDARVKLVIGQVAQRHRNLAAMKALGFCVSIEHAKFMARRFTDAGIPSLCVSAETDSDSRRDALASLRSGRVQVLFAVDLFNEGVDLPEIDTLLILRPTESALVFLQQIGRGLRCHDGEDCVTVLDFIGQAHRNFRFDLRYRTITGTTRTEVARDVQSGFPFLPAGCSMQLDRVARDIVLDNLRSAIPRRRPAMVRELQSLAAKRPEGAGSRIPLAEFIRETGLELQDVYRSGCWSGLQREAGVTVPGPGPYEQLLNDRLASALYIDAPLRLSAYQRLSQRGDVDDLTDAERRLATGFHFAVVPPAVAPASLAESLALLHRHLAITEELRELIPLLDERSEHLTYPIERKGTDGSRADVPLPVHARHTVDDVLTALGRVDFGVRAWTRTGVNRGDRTNSDLFFVTLEKSEREYSASTLYRDYAISPTLFHWESRSTTSQQSPTGQRYIRHRERGGNILSFVRERKEQDGQTMPYTFLGLADYVSHKGDRPIAFLWKLREPMPAAFFRLAKVASA